MTDAPANFPADYVPAKVWSHDEGSGGKFANINRPVSGATHETELPVGEPACGRLSAWLVVWIARQAIMLGCECLRTSGNYAMTLCRLSSWNQMHFAVAYKVRTPHFL